MQIWSHQWYQFANIYFRQTHFWCLCQIKLILFISIFYQNRHIILCISMTANHYLKLHKCLTTRWRRGDKRRCQADVRYVYRRYCKLKKNSTHTRFGIVCIEIYQIVFYKRIFILKGIHFVELHLHMISKNLTFTT